MLTLRSAGNIDRSNSLDSDSAPLEKKSKNSKKVSHSESHKYEALNSFDFSDVQSAIKYYSTFFKLDAPTKKSLLKEMQSKKSIKSTDPLFLKEFEKRVERHAAKFNELAEKKFNLIQSLYINAFEGGRFEGQLPYDASIRVLGADILRSKEFANIEHENLLVLSSKVDKKGAILNEDQFWNLIANDAFMLGTIRGAKDVLIYSMKKSPLENKVIPMTFDDKPFIEDHILWSESENRPRVLGREIAQLMHSGYALACHVPPSLGICLRCVDPAKAGSRTLVDLCEAVENTSLEQIKHFLNIDFESDKENRPKKVNSTDTPPVVFKTKKA